MPVRLRITLLFVILVFIILTLVCGSIYYVSYQSRKNTVKTRLANRAITTGRLLNEEETFDEKLVRRIDSLTKVSLIEKVIQVYDSSNVIVYTYSDFANDSIIIDKEILDRARKKHEVFFTIGDKEAIAYHYTDKNYSAVIISAAKDQDGIENLLMLRNIIFLSYFFGLLIAFVSGYIFSRRLLLPVKKIAEDVSEISVQNLTRRISTGTYPDEWYHLSNTLNQLLNRLQESFELQGRFISNASHELSTPLTSISSQLEIALQRERTAAEYRKVMHSIYQDVQHMAKLTQTLLEFAKASGNKGGLEIDMIRIDEIILHLPAEMVKINKTYTVVLEFDKLPEEEENLVVFGNEALLLTAIKNIVLNACKYSINNQAVISLTANDEFIRITISNDGSGIPQQEFEKIFEPFYRVEENRVAGGFGLGLSLAKRIIKLHRGSIHVHSEPGRKTEFTVELPPSKKLKTF